VSAKSDQKRLVIDTNIARSASETSNPTSINCRKALEAIRDLEFYLVFTPELLAEWNKHRSRFFQSWLTQMFARKLQVQLSNADVHDAKLRADISSFARAEKDALKGEKDEEEMLKDVLLLEAALATDERILSMNEADRNRFKAACEKIKAIREVIWVNPDIDEEACIEWLEKGAPPDEKRCLGYQKETK
jgi:hypothetical protein